MGIKLETLKAVIAICLYDNNLKDFQIIGTGFLVDYNQKIYLITNKHVIDNLDDFYLVFTGSEIIDNRYLRLSNKNAFFHKTSYHYNDDVDVAMIEISKELLNNSDVSKLKISTQSMQISEMKDKELREGTKIQVLGHPMNISKLNNYFPVVRGGIISQISNLFENNYSIKTILLDAFTFPGNSGGPVFINHRNGDYLIGIVSSYISPKGKNVGITNIFAFDHILEILIQGGE
jgi:S1-C subfamily serine protease